MLCNDLDMDHVDIYLFISSRDSIKFHAENKPHTFIPELVERLNLPGRWMVALLLQFELCLCIFNGL